MASQEQFEDAAKQVQNLPSRPGNDELLQLYALYKQGSEGDVKGDRPGFADFAGRAKYDAWAKQKGKTQDQAKQAYVDMVEGLKKKYAG
ncbi:MAG: acyl-CoA-binding protein [SAR324 cluster bacterium]|nr:acyl-CoA-binding protein [SAR324 cluster bacterium]